MSTFVIPSIFTAVDRISAPIIAMQAKVDAFASRAERASRRFGNSMDSTYKKLGGRQAELALAGGIGLVALGVKKFVDEASKVEDATARFQPVLGSFEKAKNLVGLLNKEAALTPYEFRDIADVAAQLLPTMGGNVEKVIKTFRMLGDASGGSVDRLNRITLGYNKALLKQKVTLESLNIIAEAGVPIFGAMAKVLYGNENATKKLFANIKDGKVPLSAMEKAFVNLTSKGGVFFNGMVIASQTFSGRLSTIRDNINLTFAEIGEMALPLLKEYQDKIAVITENVRKWAQSNQELIRQKIKGFFEGLGKAITWVVENFDKIVYWTKVYIGTLVLLKALTIANALYINALAIATGVYRVALFASNVAMGISNALMGASAFAVMGNTVAYGAFRAAIVTTTAAQTALNSVMAFAAANPIVAIIAGIGLLVAAVSLLISKYETLEEKQDRALKVNKQGGFQDEKAMLIKRAEQLSVGRSTEEGRSRAVKEAQKMIEADKARALYMQANAKDDSQKRVADRILSTIEGREQALNMSGLVFEEGQNKKELVNNEAVKQQELQRSFSESIMHQKATLTINGDTDNAKLSGGGDYIKIQTGSTFGN